MLGRSGLKTTDTELELHKYNSAERVTETSKCTELRCPT